MSDEDDKAGEAQALEESQSPEAGDAEATSGALNEARYTAHGLWERGEWRRLVEMFGPERDAGTCVQISGYVVAAHLQLGEFAEARRALRRVLSKHPASRALVFDLLVSGVHNSLGRAALLGDLADEAWSHFSQAIFLLRPMLGNEAVPAVRQAIQGADLGLVQYNVSRNWIHVNPEVEPHSPPPGDALLPELLGKLESVISAVVREGHELRINGVQVLSGDDPFLAGKVLLGAAHLVADNSVGAARAVMRCRQLKRADSLFDHTEVASWGRLFFLMAIAKTRDAGLLEQCFSHERLLQLRNRLDWRDIVDDRTYTLLNRPSNFYQVAFGIAQLRFQLGWEDARSSFEILERMQQQYELQANEHGFMDETAGGGRYDRYSILLVAEIAHRFREAGIPFLGRLRHRLRRSAELVLANLNAQGIGFQYGRSIGAYGDTAFLEILSAAAWHGVLSPEESHAGFAFCCVSTARFLNFWWDDKHGCVNLWEDGRAADPYRHKGRMLGETLSLLHQHIYTHQIWRHLGHREEHIKLDALHVWMGAQPPSQLTWFRSAENDGDQLALFTRREGSRVFSLPLVNGGEYQGSSAYLPIPYSDGLIQSAPGEDVPQLVPKLILDDGRQLMPVGRYAQIRYHGQRRVKIRWVVPKLSRVDRADDTDDSESGAEVLVGLTAGRVSYLVKLLREDEPWAGELRMDFISPAPPAAEPPNARPGRHDFAFDGGALKKLCLLGFDEVVWQPENKLGTPTGGAAGMLRATRYVRNRDLPIIVGWRMHFQE